MKIIRRVDIHYFRSLDSVILNETNDLNTFIGKNDSGKSNILKALNLFFNNSTEFGTPYSFYDDLSKTREEEARAAKGRATIWIRITFNNFVRWDSLPVRVVVKRSWNRYDETWTQSVQTPDIHPVTLSKFLNKIKFHYIPAVRSREIFSHFLQILYGSLVEDEKARVSDTTTELMSAINDGTRDMAERILDGLGFRSDIRVPPDLRNLFGALDFSTGFGGYNIPLQKRGDGIQARHVPFILDFIARHSREHHIWAYEEPENSLEISQAFKLADQFRDEFSSENQIFITTHSPAFYDLGGVGVKKWLVASQESVVEDETKISTVVEEVSRREVFDERMGMAPLLADRARHLSDELDKLRTENTHLFDVVRNAQQLQVIVEGPTDAAILGTAFEKLHGENNLCSFVAANGASNVVAFLETLLRTDIGGQRRVAGLLDNDEAGRKEFDRAKRSPVREIAGSFHRLSRTKFVCLGLLPVPEDFRGIDELFADKFKPKGHIRLPIEYFFPPEIINQARDNGVLVLNDWRLSARTGELAFEVKVLDHLAPHLPERMHHFALVVDDQCKMPFSQWIRDLPPEAFRFFEPLFASLRELAQGDDQA